jgi:hypothetical protein
MDASQLIRPASRRLAVAASQAHKPAGQIIAQHWQRALRLVSTSRSQRPKQLSVLCLLWVTSGRRDRVPTKSALHLEADILHPHTLGPTRAIGGRQRLPVSDHVLGAVAACARSCRLPVIGASGCVSAGMLRVTGSHNCEGSTTIPVGGTTDSLTPPVVGAVVHS